MRVGLWKAVHVGEGQYLVTRKVAHKREFMRQANGKLVRYPGQHAAEMVAADLNRAIADEVAA